MKRHSLVWLMWVAAALVLLSATRNPYYLGLALLWVGGIWRLSARDSTASVPFSPLRIGAVIVLLSAIFNAAMVHIGTTVLFRLPADWLLIGGAITAEALVFGALNGLALAGFLLAFSVLNQVVPVSALVRLIPRAFQPVAVVLSIAITFVPTTLRQFRHIREAQAVRGHQSRGWRDVPPLFLPLLVGGLERALGLAEAMTARGFAAETPRHSTMIRSGMVGGLGLLLLGWAGRLLTGAEWATISMAAGIAAVIAALWFGGRSVQHTRYRRQPLQRGDWLALAAMLLLAAVVLLPIPGIGHETLVFYPYPALSAPSFNPLMALATTGLFIPVFWLKPESDVSF